MTKPMINSNIFNYLEEWAPKSLAYEWDPVGLQIGSHSKPVHKIMVTLDVLEAVVDEAIEKEVDLIIAHHPLMFKPLKQVNVDSPKGRTIKKLLKHDITVYASHTNLDIADGGVNDLLFDALELTNKEILVPTKQNQLLKIAVYVPTSHVHSVMDAFHEVGAGYIGNYSHCTFQSKGYGTFKPLEGTNPYIGTTNKLEKVEEVKIETIIEEDKLSKALTAMLAVHPYEEPAYDIYPLKNKGQVSGLGRIGKLSSPSRLDVFCEQIKKAFEIEHLRVTGDLSKVVKKAAIVGGSGEKYIYDAKRKGADVYITGDMTFHAAQEALEMGLCVIDCGHYIEKIMKEATKEYLQRRLTDQVEVVVSSVNTDPFQFV